MAVELRHLRYLLAVAEQGSLSRAAAALHMTQTPLRRQISALERHLGVRLLERGPHGTRLTPAGAELARAAPAVLGAFDEALRAARNAAPLPSRVRLGYTGNLAYGIVEPVLRQAVDAEPGIVVDAEPLPRREQLTRLKQGVLDVGLLWSPLADPDLAVFPIVTQPLVVVLPDDHPLAGRTEVGAAELADEQWLDVRSDDNVGPHAELRRIAREAGFEPQVAGVINALAAGLTLVALGRGILPAPGAVVSIAPAGVVAVPIAGLAVTLLAARPIGPPAAESVQWLLRSLAGLAAGEAPTPAAS